MLTSATLAAGCARAQPAREPLTGSAVDLVTRSGSYSSDQQVLDRALNRLNRDCLVAHGFRPSLADPAPMPARDDEAAMIDLPGRAAHGYGIAAGSAHTGAPPADAYVDGLSDADQRRYTDVLLGSSGPRRAISLPVGGQVTVPERGCLAGSRARLGGDVTSWAVLTYVPDRLSELLADRSLAAPRYRTALDAWRACMRPRGYPDASPDAAVQRLAQERTDSEDFRRREIAVAVADGECAAQAHLSSVGLTVQRQLAAALPEPDRRALADATLRWQAAVARARIVASP